MPTISSFYGILMRMFFNDHVPPHFHVQYAEFKASLHGQTAAQANCPAKVRLKWNGMSSK